MDVMDDLRNELEKARGHWPRIAAETGVDYFTVARIARGDTQNPRIDTVEKLRAWLAANPPPYVSVSEEHAPPQQAAWHPPRRGQMS